MRRDWLAPLIVFAGLSSMAVAGSSGSLRVVPPPAGHDSGDSGHAHDTGDTAADDTSSAADDTSASTDDTSTADTATDTADDTAVPVFSAAQKAGEQGGFKCAAVGGAPVSLGGIALLGLVVTARRRREV